MAKGCKPARRIPRKRGRSRKESKSLSKKQGHNGTRVTRTKGIKRQVARNSVLHHGKHHDPQFPGSRSVPKTSLAIRKRVMEYKREQALLAEEKANCDRDPKLGHPSPPKVPSCCDLSDFKGRDEVVRHFFENTSGHECLLRNWIKLNVDCKSGVVDAVIRYACWDCRLVEMIVADEPFLRGLNQELLVTFVGEIVAHLQHLLRQTDDCSILWNLFALQNKDIFQVLLGGVRRCASNVVLKCRSSFDVMEYIVQQRANGNEQHFLSLMSDFVDDIRGQMLLFPQGCVFLGCLVSSYPAICENVFGAVSLEAEMKNILCHPYQAVCVLPLLSSAESEERRKAMHFVSRVVITAAATLEREALSPHGKQVLDGAVDHARRNRDRVFVGKDEFKKAEVMSAMS